MAKSVNTGGAQVITTGNSTRRADEVNRVKPKDVVKVVWKGDKFHAAGSVSEIHPVQFEKMLQRGLVEKWSQDAEDRLTASRKSTPDAAATGNKGGEPMEL